MFVSHVDLAFENDKMDGCFTSVTTVCTRLDFFCARAIVSFWSDFEE